MQEADDQEEEEQNWNDEDWAGWAAEDYEEEEYLDEMVDEETTWQLFVALRDGIVLCH